MQTPGSLESAAEQSGASAARQTVSLGSRQPFPIWCGLTLGNRLRLLSLRPACHWSRAGRFSLVSMAAVVNSMLAAIERITYRRQIDALPSLQPPLFILGHWRSGTTLLQSWLAEDPQFTPPTVCPTCFPDHFLASERWLPRRTRPLAERPAQASADCRWPHCVCPVQSRMFAGLLSYPAVRVPGAHGRFPRIRFEL